MCWAYMNGVVDVTAKRIATGIVGGVISGLIVRDAPFPQILLFSVGGSLLVLGVVILADKFLTGEDSVKGDEMHRLTVGITEEQNSRIEALSGDSGRYESKSEAVRNLIDAGEEYGELADEIERLQERLESREERIDELEEQLARRSQVEEKIDTLAKRAESSDAPFFIRWYRWYRNK